MRLGLQGNYGVFRDAVRGFPRCLLLRLPVPVVRCFPTKPLRTQLNQKTERSGRHKNPPGTGTKICQVDAGTRVRCPVTLLDRRAWVRSVPAVAQGDTRHIVGCTHVPGRLLVDFSDLQGRDARMLYRHRAAEAATGCNMEPDRRTGCGRRAIFAEVCRGLRQPLAERSCPDRVCSYCARTLHKPAIMVEQCRPRHASRRHLATDRYARVRLRQAPQ